VLGSPEQAEDAVQDTLLRAWRGRRGLRQARSARAWLYKIARNACFDRMQRNEPQAIVVHDEPSNEDLHAVVVNRETLELTVMAAIDLLPPRQRDAVILCDLLDFRPGEAAGLLGVRVAAVNSALQRARAFLREELDPDRREEWRASDGRERKVAERFVDLVAD
jgi:RNA polymerase sigma-70 factor (ECF subfamily)